MFRFFDGCGGPCWGRRVDEAGEGLGEGGAGYGDVFFGNRVWGVYVLV